MISLTLTIEQLEALIRVRENYVRRTEDGWDVDRNPAILRVFDSLSTLPAGAVQKLFETDRYDGLHDLGLVKVNAGGDVVLTEDGQAALGTGRHIYEWTKPKSRKRKATT